MAACICGCGMELSARQRKYAAEQCKKKMQREEWLQRIYNISVEDYDAILIYQGGCCAICGRKPKDGETFHVDHEHEGSPSGKVRGILCPYCNTRLVGRLRSATKAQAMADYLLNPPAARALGREVIAPGRPRRRRQPRRRPRRQ